MERTEESNRSFKAHKYQRQSFDEESDMKKWAETSKPTENLELPPKRSEES